jgi:homoserine dehydrogenase
MRELRIGLLGFGTVGAGVVEGLQNNGDLVAERIGTRLVVTRIADLDWTTPRGVTAPPETMTRDAMAVTRDPAVDVVVELIGGTGIAKELILSALQAGKAVVTANKALLAKHGPELWRTAARHGVDLCFEASVGGGIPVIRAIREGLVANRFTGLYGILNGTCNYVLSRMETEEATFEDALRDAQAGGYAEADSALDIDGHDTAHKTVVLAALLGDTPVDPASLAVEGIRQVAREDIALAGQLDCRIKLLAQIECRADGPYARVHPVLVPRRSLLAQVNHTFNAVMIKSDMTDDTFYYGRGAGRRPTASAVIGDLADIARNLANGCPRRVPGLDAAKKPVAVGRAAAGPERRYVRFFPGSDTPCDARVRRALEAAGIRIARCATLAESPTARPATALVTEPVAEEDLLSVVRPLADASHNEAEFYTMQMQEGL